MQVRTPTLIGREDEFAALSRTLSSTRSGRGGVIFLVGEAGIGKSRLAAEAVVSAADAGMRVLRGRSGPLGGTVPFRPLAEALLGLLRTGVSPRPDDLDPYQRVLGRLIPEWREPEPSDEPDSLIVLAEAVLRLIAHAGTPGGCVVLLEDLHRADAETLAVVEYLADNLIDQPAMLIAAVRSGPGVAQELVRSAASRSTATVVELAPLTPESVRHLVCACLGGPPQGMPTTLIERLRLDCAGNPFMIEEMLHDMVSRGMLISHGDRWELADESPARVPPTVVRSIVQRADNLGSENRAVLSCAAVLGRRFPLDVLLDVTGLAERRLLSCLHAGIAAQLVVPDEQSPDWYAFRHALTAEALLSDLGPTSRSTLARRSAEAIEARYPALPDVWCQLAAELRLIAGDPAAAARHLAEAGRRALASGAANSAVSLLERAHALVDAHDDGSSYVDLLESLLLALLEAGLVDRALAFASTLDDIGAGAMSAHRRAALHTQLAWVAAMAGRWADGAAQIQIARDLAGTDAADQHTAPVDVVASYVALGAQRPGGLAEAERLARQAIDAAQRAALPVVSCRAWQLLGIVSRRRGIEESDACFSAMATVARDHHLLTWRIRAMALRAANDALRDGTVDTLTRVRDEAMRIGAITLSHGLDANIAFQLVLHGDYQAAHDVIERCGASAARLSLLDIVQYVAVARAALAAHQGRRPDMDRALAEFHRWGGETSQYRPLAMGLCQAVCALLEEDHEAAYGALVLESTQDKHNPTIFNLSGRNGLRVLVAALRHETDLTTCGEVLQAPPSQLRWNKQFVLAAHAVLLGRSGQHDRAEQTWSQARMASAPFKTAHSLIGRLVAEAALHDGWGDPVTWLRQAEQYFHQTSMPAVSATCRALLRRSGVSVGQRRTGHERIPDELQRLCVTAREHDVLELLLDRMGNKEIAGRLHISPRTVEKHVASLISKTAADNRTALIARFAPASRRAGG